MRVLYWTLFLLVAAPTFVFCVAARQTADNNQTESVQKLNMIISSLEKFRQDPLTARKILAEGYKINKGLDRRATAILNYYNAELSLIYHHTDTALKLSQLSMDGFKTINDSTGVLRASIINSRVLLYKGEIQKANANLIAIARRAEAMNLRDILARSWNFIGISYFMSKDYKACFEFSSKALELADELNDSLEMALSYEHLGYYYYGIGKLDSAIMLNKISLGIRQRMNDLPGSAENYENVGGFSNVMNKFGEGQQNIGKALQIHEGYRDSIGLGSIYSNLGYISEKRGNYTAALNHYLNALEIRKKTKELRGLVISNKRIADLFEKMGNLEQALAYYKIYDQLKDSVSTATRQELLAEMSAKYNLDARDTRIRLLEKDQQLNNTIRLFLLLLSAILAVMLIAIFIAYRNKKATNNQLIRQKDELEKLYSERNKFFGIISHDLRGPFQVFLSHTQILSEDLNSLSRDDVSELAHNLYQSARRQHKLLEDLLAWANAVRGIAGGNPEEFDITAMSDEICFLYEDMISRKKITVTKEYSGPVLVFSLAKYINAVLRNVLSNAIKFSYSEGHIEISISKNNEAASVIIRDHGVGIDKEKLMAIKNGAYLSTPGTENETGTGLGLLLCKELTERCSGSFKIESDENKGTIVTLVFPNHPREV